MHFDPEEKPSSKPEKFPIENVGFPYDEKLNYENDDEEFEKHFYQNQEAEVEENEKPAQKKREMRVNDVLDFFEENSVTQTGENEEAIDFREEKIDFDKINVEEQFFLNKVEIDESEEENKEEEQNQANEFYKSEAYALENQKNENMDFSYEDIVTPQKELGNNKGVGEQNERVSYRPNSESMKKRMNWWSGKKS